MFSTGEIVGGFRDTRLAMSLRRRLISKCLHIVNDIIIIFTPCIVPHSTSTGDYADANVETASPVKL